MQHLVAHSRSPALTLCMMAATQCGVTRTPISTALILIVTAKSFSQSAGQGQPAFMPVVFPLLVISVVTSMLVSNFFTPVRCGEDDRRKFEEPYRNAVCATQHCRRRGDWTIFFPVSYTHLTLPTKA